MNNKDFIHRLADANGISPTEAQNLATAFVGTIAEHLDDDTTLAVPSFGTFEVKKKMERIVVNPATKQRQLIPPKLVLAFKPSNILKDKMQ